jgi:hypothetical protein
VDDLKSKLIQAHKDGNFFEFIQEVYYKDRIDEKLLPSILAELNNTGKLNLVELFNSVKNTTENHDFFSTRRVFEEVLPYINAPVKDIADCVKHLTLEAGQDMSAYMLLPPFKEFCKKDTGRTKTLFDFALTNIDEDFDHLSTAIEAGASNDEVTYVNQAVDLLNHENKLIIQRAIFALGRINYQDKMLLEPIAVAIRNSSVSTPTDEILAASMRALFAVISQSDNLETFFLGYLNTHSEHFGERYVHAASEILF